VDERVLLDRGLAELGLNIPEHARQRLIRYIELLAKWNQTYNLTAVREPEKMVSHHLLDSLAVLPHLEFGRMIDVGTGAGLPGIPLAITRPECEFTLLDSNRKKVSFLTQVVMELMLANAKVHLARVEEHSVEMGYDVVISRAFAEVGEFLRLAGGLCSPSGTVAAMKGIYPYEELREITPPFELERVVKLNVPNVDGDRHLVLMKRAF
jgi:16S rRNA (guanine527-N7)-methyltransferase